MCNTIPSIGKKILILMWTQINYKARLFRDIIYYSFIGHKYVQLPRYEENIGTRVKLGPKIQHLLILLKRLSCVKVVYVRKFIAGNICREKFCQGKILPRII